MYIYIYYIDGLGGGDDEGADQDAGEEERLRGE